MESKIKKLQDSVCMYDFIIFLAQNGLPLSEQ
jgi:hypothetical protein